MKDEKKKPKKADSSAEQVIVNPPEVTARPVEEQFRAALLETVLDVKTRLIIGAKAAINGIPQDVLETVYLRGALDKKPEHLSREQHALNRVNSFISFGEAFLLDHDLVPLDEKIGLKGTGGKARPHIERETNPYNGETTYHVVDSHGRRVHSTNKEDEAKQHLARNYSGMFHEAAIEMDPAKREVGTKSLVKTYRDATPGQEDADISEASKMKGEDPCWDDYEMVGTKKKNGKEVPNCVPKEEVDINEISNELLQRYTDKAKKSYDDATAAGDYKKSYKRSLNVMKAQGKKIANTTKDIKKALRNEDVNEMFTEATNRMDLSKSAVGRVYSVQFTYRGMNRTLQMYFPSLTRPTADVINMQLGKSYQGANLKRYDPIDRFTKDPLVVVREEKDGKKLNKPFRTPGGPKKFAVYVKSESGGTKKVTFGDPNMEIKRDDPNRRKAYRSRHNCDNPGPKTKANYWSCRNWASKPVGK